MPRRPPALRSSLARALLAGLLAAGSATAEQEPAEAPKPAPAALTPAQRREKAVQNAGLALDMAGLCLDRKEFVEAAGLADLADRCAQVSGDEKAIAEFRARAAAVRAKCPPEAIGQARAINRELVAAAEEYARTGRLPDAVRGGGPGPATRPAATRPMAMSPGAPGKPPAHEKTTDFTVAAGQLVLPAPVAFDPGADALRPESQAPLVVVLDFLEARPLMTTLRIEAHADAATPEQAMAVSKRRARAVKQWLVDHGADPRRLLAVGFGDTRQPAGVKPAARVEFHVAAQRGKPVNNRPLDGGGQPAEE